MESHEPLVKTSKQRLFESICNVAVRSKNAALDLLYPPVCFACQEPILNRDSVCPQCWLKLHTITAPMCPILGLPFDIDLGDDAISVQAISDSPPFERARSGVVYNDFARMVVSRLKYGDQPDLARFCAHIMIGAGADVLSDDAVLVPVPLHWRRQLSRRYNQSSELCKAISKQTGCDVAFLLTRRQKNTPQQVGLTTSQRARNVQGVFSIDAREAERYAGRRLVLVDDVITTGATVCALTRELNRSGFDHISVLSFARVVIGV